MVSYLGSLADVIVFRMMDPCPGEKISSLELEQCWHFLKGGLNKGENRT